MTPFSVRFFEASPLGAGRSQDKVKDKVRDQVLKVIQTRWQWAYPWLGPTASEFGGRLEEEANQWECNE